MNNEFFVAIVGAGPAGVFAAIELSRQNKDIKICLIEKGNDIKDRKCPALEKKIKCCNCKTCGITSGWGGGGAFSDGKLTYSHVIGGHLSSYCNLEEVMKYVDSIYNEFGAPDSFYNPSEDFVKDFSKKAYENNLKLYSYPVKHMGTDRSTFVLSGMLDYLRSNKNITIFFNEKVNEVFGCGSSRDRYLTVITDKQTITAKNVLIAPGREGSSWLLDILKNQGIEYKNNLVDIGVRVEIPSEVMKDITNEFYDLKLEYYSKTFNDRVRTFCVCPNGEVIIENYNGIITVNGHSYRDIKTPNTNFSILVSTDFTEPFDYPLGYGKAITSLSNMLTKGAIVQRLGDFYNGRRSTPQRIEKGFVEPSLKSAVPGDISFALPYRHVKNIIEMLEALGKLIPGVDSEHTLMYATEAKFYSSKVQVDDNMQTSIEGLYVAGDGAGLTRGLMQASISGILVAKNILKNI